FAAHPIRRLSSYRAPPASQKCQPAAASSLTPATGVEPFARSLDPKPVPLGPTRQRQRRLEQGPAERREPIFHPRRNRRIDRPHDQPVAPSPRRVSVSIRCEMPSMARLSSLKRRGPSPSSATTKTVHLSPMRLRISRTAGHALWLSRWRRFFWVGD